MNEAIKRILKAMQSQGIKLEEGQSEALTEVMTTLISAHTETAIKEANTGLEKNRNDIKEELFAERQKNEELKKNNQGDVDIDALIAEKWGQQEGQYKEAVTNKEAELAEALETITGLKSEKSEMIKDSKIDAFIEGSKHINGKDAGVKKLVKMLIKQDYTTNDNGDMVFTDQPDRISKGGKMFSMDDYIVEDLLPNYGSALGVKAATDANVETDNNNPFFNGINNPNPSQNLNQMDRDSISDEDYIAKRQQQLQEKNK